MGGKMELPSVINFLASCFPTFPLVSSLHPSPTCWQIKTCKSHWMLLCTTATSFQQAHVHVYTFTVDGHLCSHKLTQTHICRVWAMQYNKQRGRNVVSFAPCAIVEKPHEGFWVLKDKPWLAGRESVMQQENCVFHPFSVFHVLSNLFLFFIPSSAFFQFLCLSLPIFFLLHFFHSVAY